MLFWTFVIVCAISTVLYFWNDRRHWEKQNLVLNIVSAVLAWGCGITVIICLIGMTFFYIRTDATIEKNNQIYNSLSYQYENNVFDNDDDVIGKKELYNQIQDWNADLAYYQFIQDDFWLGIFYPNIFDQFEFIEYEEVE